MEDRAWLHVWAIPVPPATRRHGRAMLPERLLEITDQLEKKVFDQVADDLLNLRGPPLATRN
ncbi:hypothetical protein M2271_002079 [Streptomyces sp. LBL]|nr:hypothetical protein [Streptomyces sp. LBL]